MKKLLITLLIICISSLVFAELNPPHRYFEMGIDTNVGFSNNYFNYSSFLESDTIVFDFTKMSQDLRNGLTLDFNADINVFINANFGKKFRIGFFSGIDSWGIINIHKDLIDFLAKGNIEGDHSISATVGMDSAFFVESGFKFNTFIKNVGIKFESSFFVPIMYLPNTKVMGKVKMNDDGSMLLEATGNVEMYTLFSENFMTEEDVFTFNDTGLDFSLAVEYPLLSNLDIGVEFNHIPAVKAALYNKISTSVSTSMQIDSVLDSLGKDSEEEETDEEEEGIISDEVFEVLTEPFKINRPFEMLVAATFRPFGNWFDIRGDLGVVFYDPIYINFNVGAGLHFVKMCKMGGYLFNLNFTTGYNERIWMQKLDLALNLRLFEINVGVSTRSSDFIKSFTGTGLGAYVGFALGF